MFLPAGVCTVQFPGTFLFKRKKNHDVIATHVHTSRGWQKEGICCTSNIWYTVLRSPSVFFLGGLGAGWWSTSARCSEVIDSDVSNDLPVSACLILMAADWTHVMTCALRDGTVASKDSSSRSQHLYNLLSELSTIKWSLLKAGGGGTTFGERRKQRKKENRWRMERHCT